MTDQPVLDLGALQYEFGEFPFLYAIETERFATQLARGGSRAGNH